MAIRIETGYDGANPPDPAAVERLGEEHFRVRPFSEDGDANYKFALNVRAINDGAAPRDLRLDVDWDDLVYKEDRVFVYVGGGDDWAYRPCQTAGPVTLVRCTVPPGATEIGQSPAYGLERARRFEDGLAAAGYAASLVGRSEAGREIRAYAIGDGPTPLLVYGRVHPYESAASFCLEGLMSWLAAAGEAQRDLRRRYRFTVVPLPNPDGVFLGTCKRTARANGVDLSHDGAHGRDATARALLAVMDAVRPRALLDLHGWMWLNQDGLHYTHDGFAERYLAAANRQPPLAGDEWRTHRVDDRPGSGSPLLHCWRSYDTVGASTSFRWPVRSVPQMRAIGQAALAALCEAL